MKKPTILFDIDYTLFNTYLFKKSKLTRFLLYKEVTDVLCRLSEIATLGIFSEGEEDFQLRKLEMTGVKDYFPREHTFIVSDKSFLIKDILAKYEHGPLFLVDDKLNILQKAKEENSEIFCFWVRRGFYARRTEIEDFLPDKHSPNLSVLPKFVLSRL
jgi:hypothetical protein